MRSLLIRWQMTKYAQKVIYNQVCTLAEELSKDRRRKIQRPEKTPSYLGEEGLFHCSRRFWLASSCGISGCALKSQPFVLHVQPPPLEGI